MIPCKFCGVSAPGLRGLKQVGKTRNSDTHFERRDRCLDCGATLRMVGDNPTEVGTPTWRDEWTPPSTTSRQGTAGGTAS